MDAQEIKKYIEDYSEVRLQALRQTDQFMISSIQKELREHEEKSMELRVQFYKDIQETVQSSVTKTIKDVVNGKIDRLTNHLQEHIVRVEPVVRQFEISKRRHEDIEEIRESTTKWGYFITAIAVIGGAFLLLIRKFL